MHPTRVGPTSGTCLQTGPGYDAWHIRDSFFKIFIYLFMYFWLLWFFAAACGLSLVAASRGYSSLWCACFSLRWLLLLRSMGSRHMGFSSCGSWAQQLWLVCSRAQAQQLWCTGLAAPRHVGSSQTRAQTRVPCIGKRIPNHCATREVPHQRLLINVVQLNCIDLLNQTSSLVNVFGEQLTIIPVPSPSAPQPTNLGYYPPLVCYSLASVYLSLVCPLMCLYEMFLNLLSTSESFILQESTVSHANLEISP